MVRSGGVLQSYLHRVVKGGSLGGDELDVLVL